MRRPLVALLTVCVLVTAAERVIDDTDENSEDIFERPPRLESIDEPTVDEFGVSPLPGEIQFHRRGHEGRHGGDFEVADDDMEENQGSDGFPRMTAMNNEEPPAVGTNETAAVPPMLPLPTGDDRPLDGIRTDTRTGAKKVVEPFPTLLAAGSDAEKETIIELTMAPNTSVGSFGSALAEGDHAPVIEYDIEESAGGKSDEEMTPVERNLTAAVVFHSRDSSTTPSSPTTLTTTAATASETVTPHASHFPTRDRAGIFPSESTEQLTSHGRPPTEHPSPAHATTKTAAESIEATDPPFAMVDPTIFNPDHLFAVPGAPGIEEIPEEAKEEIDDEDFELKKALSSEAHLDTSTVESIMSSIATTLRPTEVEVEKNTVTSTTPLPSTAPSSTTPSSSPSSTTTTMSTPSSTVPTTSATEAPVQKETTTPFQLPPLIVTTSTTPSPSTETTTTTSTPSTTTEFISTSNFPEEPVRMHGEHGHHHETPASAEEVHFEDRPFETTESMPFDPTAAHFGDSQERLWESTHGQHEMEETTTTEPLIAHKTPFHIMVKGIDYLPDFADPDSGKFRKLRDQLLPDFRRHFERSLPDFIAVDLSSIEKERGVVVHGVVYTRASIVDLYETANKFEAELEANKMRMGGNEVEGGTFTINGINARAPVERVQQQAASADGSIAFIIAGIITIGVIVILVVVFVIILMNNHRRGVGSIKLKEDAEAEAGRRAQMHYGNVNLMSYNSPPPPQPPSTQLLQSLPHVVINTKSGSRPSSTMTSPTTPRANMMH